MYVRQNFAIIYNNKIQNIMICDNYELANQLARVAHGNDGIAIDITQYPSASIGDLYIDNILYKVNEETGEKFEIEYVPTSDEQVIILSGEVSQVKEELHPTINTDTCTLDELKTFKMNEFGKICSDSIFAGSDVETAQGLKHFSYTDDDQRNLKAAADLAAQTGLQIPYHADKEDCCLWDAFDIINVYGTNEMLKTYQTTYMNQMNKIIRAAQDKETILSLEYGMELPESNQTTVDMAMNQAKLVFQSLLNKLNANSTQTE